ncbi:MAG: Abi family protein [Clostridiales bacterium]|nr:Abi family protein [Clostridiales bacterium]
MNDKLFKTIDEQLNILIDRGLIIENKDKAKKFLLHNNYYRVIGYSLTLCKHDIFSKNVSFGNIVDIYSFDHELRHILLKYIEIIEVAFKSVYAYKLTKKHGTLGYLNASLFTDTEKYNKIMEKSQKQKQISLYHESYIRHFMHSDIPFEAYVDLLTISDISILYSISETNIKQEVATEFGLCMKRGGEILGNFMHSITIIRNLCAHGGRLFNRLFEQKPSLNRSEQALLIKRSNIIDNSHLYGFIIIMRRLLSDDRFLELKNNIIELTQKYPFVSMRYYGFRDDWKDVL